MRGHADCKVFRLLCGRHGFRRYAEVAPPHGGAGAGSAHRPRIDATLLRVIAVLVDIAGITGT